MNAPIDISGTVLRTERLALRPWKQKDLEDFFAYASVDGVGQMAGWIPHESIAVSQKILNGFIEKKRTFALEYQERAVGSLGIEEYVEEEWPEYDSLRGRALGFVLAKPYWGQGLMPEAVREVIRYLFEEVRLDFLICNHYVENTRSARVQQKCGFRPGKEGIHTRADGVPMHSKLNILTAEDYFAKKTKP